MTGRKRYFISPKDGTAARLDADRSTVTLCYGPRLPGGRTTARIYLERFPDTTRIEASESELPEVLSDYAERSRCLDLSLMLFDDELSLGLREDIGKCLSKNIRHQSNFDYVLDVLLAAPLPKSADTNGARVAASPNQTVSRFVDLVAASQPTVKAIYHAWMQTSVDPMIKHAGADKVRGALIDAGVFRRLVLEAPSKEKAHQLTGSLALSVHGRCEARIVKILVSTYAEILPNNPSLESLRKQITSEIGTDSRESIVLPETSDQEGEPHPRPPRRRTNHEKYEAAKSQVTNIADLYRQGKDQLADSRLEQLVKSQTESTYDFSFVVMSLCNLASKCSIAGRLDVSLKQLNRAISEYPTGLDAITYLQIGGVFRALRNYETAADCFLRAGQIDKTKAVDSQYELAKTRTLQGDFEAASRIFEALPNIDTFSQAQCALGKLHRMRGDFGQAYQCYRKAIMINSQKHESHHDHQAIAGWAETNRQTGHLSKSLGKYQLILQKYADAIDPLPLKHYTLATSHLLRLNHKFSDALVLLQRLESDYPHDVEVNTQLGKVHALLGNDFLSRKYVDRTASLAVARDAAAERLLSSLGRDEYEFQSILDNPTIDYSADLASCHQAMSAISDRKFLSAIQVLGDISSCNKLTRDFAAVLKFHAQKEMNPSYDYKSDQVLCRIAKKRGFKELQASVLAIAVQAFDSALKSESKMMLIVAA